MYCSNCGKKINSKNILCNNCGAKVDTAISLNEIESTDKNTFKLSLRKIILISLFVIILICIIIFGIVILLNQNKKITKNENITISDNKTTSSINNSNINSNSSNSSSNMNVDENNVYVSSNANDNDYIVISFVQKNTYRAVYNTCSTYGEIIDISYDENTEENIYYCKIKIEANKKDYVIRELSKLEWVSYINIENTITQANTITDNKNISDNTIAENDINQDTTKEENINYGVWADVTDFRHDYQKNVFEKFEVKKIVYSKNHFIIIPTLSKYPNLNKKLEKLKNEVIEYVKSNADKHSCYVTTDIMGTVDNDKIYTILIVRSLTKKQDVGFPETAWYELRYDIEKDYIISLKEFDGTYSVTTPIVNGVLQY